MKIAVYHNLPSGGAKRTLFESMKRLSERHTLDVYTLDTSDRDFCNLEQFSKAEHIFHFLPSRRFRSPLGRLNQLQRWRDLQRLDDLSRQIAEKIDADGYDVVFAEPCMWTQAPLVLRYLKTPAIYYCHEPPRHLYENVFRDAEAKSKISSGMDRIDPFIRIYRRTARGLDQAATRAARRVLVNSVFIRNQVRQVYDLDSTISYNGVDTDLFHPKPEVRTKPYVLSVGAIQPHKGFGFLVESLSYVGKRIRPSLYLIGNMVNPEEQDMLQALAREKEVELHIQVGVDQTALIRKYNESILVVYAPYNEPFGLVPLEAMACGKPVVGVNEGGVKETVVHEYTGLLVDRDAREFGSAVQSLLKTPALIEQYGRNGRNYVLETWSWDKAVQQLERHLSCVIQ